MNNYFDADLINKYKMSGPRYTSYPTAVQFTDDFTETDLRQQIQLSNEKSKAISVYIHIPFCEHVCYYCACNKIITRNHKKADEYLEYLFQDISSQAELISEKRKLLQLHFGGGSPTFLSAEQLNSIIVHLKKYFDFAADDEGEFSIEIDPRTIDSQELKALREIGFNRISFGIQDMDIEVQKAVNRVQTRESVQELMDNARKLGFQSISMDLIYGLPKQHPSQFTKTIEDIIAFSPDRLAVFNYAHMPHLFGAQKQINAQDLPTASQKLTLLENTITQLTESGYEFIGLDHFAKPSDSLVTHQKNGTLYRNFQGYSTFSNCDLFGFGISAISQINDCYSQHEKARQKYYQAIDDKRIPTARGIILNQDDKIRRHVITEIMCNLKLDLNEVSRKFNINAQDYFAREWLALRGFAEDDLIELNDNIFFVKPLGRLLIRNIAMTFDAYLQSNNQKRFSQVL